MSEGSRRYRTETNDDCRAVAMNGAARTIEMNVSRSQQRRRRHNSAMFSGNGNRTEDNQMSNRDSRTMTEQASHHGEDPLLIVADEFEDLGEIVEVCR